MLLTLASILQRTLWPGGLFSTRCNLLRQDKRLCGKSSRLPLLDSRKLAMTFVHARALPLGKGNKLDALAAASD